MLSNRLHAKVRRGNRRICTTCRTTIIPLGHKEEIIPDRKPPTQKPEPFKPVMSSITGRPYVMVFGTKRTIYAGNLAEAHQAAQDLLKKEGYEILRRRLGQKTSSIIIRTEANSTGEFKVKVFRS